MKHLHSTLIALFAVSLLAGCGGGGLIGAGSGKATGSISITWPAPSRLLPKASNSVLVEIRDSGANLISSKILVRPPTGGTTTANFTDLPIGTFTLTATAFPEAGGIGVKQATGSTNITTSIATPFNTSVTMDSTIAGFTVNGHDSSQQTVVEEFKTVGLTVSAIDATGSIVLTRPEDLSITDPSGRVSFANGVLTGESSGTTSITIRDNDSGKSITSPVKVDAFKDGYYKTTIANPATVRIKSLATAKLPNAAVNRWQYFAPYGTDLSDQQLQSTSGRVILSVGSQASTQMTEPSGFMRKFYGGELNSASLANPRELPVEYDITVQTATRTLAVGRPTVVPIDLTLAEKAAYTAETTRCNYSSSTVQGWILAHNLAKLTTETTIDFAKRVCAAMKADFTYEVIPAAKASDHINLKKGDCGGLALVIQAVLRSNNIPCRFISGGYVEKNGGPLNPDNQANWGTCSHHVTLEMWHRTAGWVRVDGSNSVNNGAANVGMDDNKFVAFSYGEEFDVSQVSTGLSPAWLIQVPGYWAFFNTGDTTGFAVDYLWTVTRS